MKIKYSRIAASVFFTFFLSAFICTNNAVPASAKGNTKIENFAESKKLLYEKIYKDHRKTFYCGFPYSKKRKIDIPDEFSLDFYSERAAKVEVEHIVPVENFGRAFIEWREGHPLCFHKKNGRPYKGRQCAEKASREFNLMEADLYNLVPAVGSVNAARGNKNFAPLDKNTPYFFGKICPVKIDGNRVEPPEYTRGFIARTYFYMEREYDRFRMSDQTKKIMTVWNKEYPVDQWECTRAKRIENVQKNRNIFTYKMCVDAKLW